MPCLMEIATMTDAAAIAALRLAASRGLTEQFGRGTWSYAAESELGVKADITASQVLIARDGGSLIATLRLSQRNPWIADTTFFTPTHAPWFLTSMAVSPKRQRQGVGRACIADVKEFVAGWGGDAVRLDAYDAVAGAGEFYRKCGFREVQRAPYNGTPLIFFEYLVPSRHPERTLSTA